MNLHEIIMRHIGTYKGQYILQYMYYTYDICIYTPRINVLVFGPPVFAICPPDF